MKPNFPEEFKEVMDEEIECPECEGLGEIEYQTINLPFQGISFVSLCPVCDGVGDTTLLNLFEDQMGDTDELLVYYQKQKEENK
jgi:DnaJ-class molecular chaperone